MVNPEFPDMLCNTTAVVLLRKGIEGSFANLEPVTQERDIDGLGVVFGEIGIHLYHLFLLVRRFFAASLQAFLSQV